MQTIAEGRARTFFQGKRITMMGLGLLGRGVGDAEFIASFGADLIVTDLARAEKLRPSIERLARFSNIRYRLHGHAYDDFRDRDLIVKAAGVREDSPYLAEARRHGIPIRMSADLFAEFAEVPVIGVTGTRGKTTTTYMIEAILRDAGVVPLLGGNIPGVSTLALVGSVREAHTAVFELDSWQLQGFGELHKSPDVAVFTTFYPDHLAYYDHDLARYFSDKTHIFAHQRDGSPLIVGSQVLPILSRVDPGAAARATVASVDDVAEWDIPLPGVHNRYDAACARAAALAYGIDEYSIRRTLSTFRGVPGRLELVRERNGVRVYNDTTAVIPEATCAGLAALAGAPITLIAGGNDKGNDIADLVSAARSFAKRVILVPGSGSDVLARALPDAVRAPSLDAALESALLDARPGDAILFSPAFSSRGTYDNVYERGRQFVAALDTLWNE